MRKERNLAEIRNLEKIAQCVLAGGYRSFTWKGTTVKTRYGDTPKSLARRWIKMATNKKQGNS